MLTRWTAGLDGDRKTEIRNHILAARTAFERLRVLIEEDIHHCYECQEKVEMYNDASWPLHQASCTGEVRALRSILRLIDLKEQGTDNDDH